MNKEQTMREVDGYITGLFEQVITKDKIVGGYDDYIVCNFIRVATDALFYEYTHGECSLECERKWQWIEKDIEQEIANGHKKDKWGVKKPKKDEWRAHVQAINRSDLVEKIAQEQLYTRKFEYKKEFTQMFIKIFDEIKGYIRFTITWTLFSGSTDGVMRFLNNY